MIIVKKDGKCVDVEELADCRDSCLNYFKDNKYNKQDEAEFLKKAIKFYAFEIYRFPFYKDWTSFSSNTSLNHHLKLPLFIILFYVHSLISQCEMIKSCILYNRWMWSTIKFLICSYAYIYYPHRNYTHIHWLTTTSLSISSTEITIELITNVT